MQLGKSLLVVAVAVLLAGGCAWFMSRAQPERPQVKVVNGKITVDPADLDFRNKPGAVTILWELPEGSGYTFDDAGIVIKDSEKPRVPARDEFIDCRSRDKGQRFSCLNRHQNKGEHKYTIILRDASGKPLELDPHIFN